MSHTVSHSFMISADIHLTPEFSAPKDLMEAFCTSSQLWDTNPIRAWSHPMLVCFLKELDTGVGRDVGGWRGFPFLQSVIP